MKRFKVGDKVRTVRGVLFTPKGTEGTVTEVYTEHYDYAVDFPELSVRAMNDDELELVTPNIEVGDKVRASREFEVGAVKADGSIQSTENLIYGPRFYTFEVIEKAPQFTVGQVLTTEDELKALPEGARVARFFRDGSGRVFTKRGSRFISNDSYELSAVEMLRSGSAITVVWLP